MSPFVSASDATPRDGIHVRRRNGAVDAVPHAPGAPSRGCSQPILLHLSPAARGALQKRVTGCLRECVVATVPLIHHPSRGVQHRAGQRTAGGLTSECFEPLGHRRSEEITLVIVEDVAKAPNDVLGNFVTPVALECTGQGIASLVVVERGVGCTLREPPSSRAACSGSCVVRRSSCASSMSDILVRLTDNVNYCVQLRDSRQGRDAGLAGRASTRRWPRRESATAAARASGCYTRSQCPSTGSGSSMCCGVSHRAARSTTPSNGWSFSRGSRRDWPNSTAARAFRTTRSSAASSHERRHEPHRPEALVVLRRPARRRALLPGLP